MPYRLLCFTLQNGGGRSSAQKEDWEQGGSSLRAPTRRTRKKSAHNFQRPLHLNFLGQTKIFEEDSQYLRYYEVHLPIPAQGPLAPSSWTLQGNEDGEVFCAGDPLRLPPFFLLCGLLSLKTYCQILIKILSGTFFGGVRSVRKG